MCCIFVYPVGVPLAFFALLYPLRETLASEGAVDGFEEVHPRHVGKPRLSSNTATGNGQVFKSFQKDFKRPSKSSTNFHNLR